MPIRIVLAPAFSVSASPELQEVLRGACRRAKGEKIELADLPFQLKHGPLPAERHLPLDKLLEQVERRDVLRCHGGERGAVEGILDPHAVLRGEREAAHGERQVE